MVNLPRLLAIILFFTLSIASSASRADTICSDTSSAATTGSLTDSGGTSSNYSNNENCSFLIQPTGGGSIVLSFSQFNYENNFDFVRVYNGTTTSAPLLGSFTGSSTPADVTASSGAMLIVHSSDFSVTRSGFQATWSTGSGGSNTLCNDTSSTATSGTLYDSGGPSNNYGNSEDCSFLIQPTGGGTVTLSFSDFNLQNADQLRVYNGSDASAPLLATLTGSSLPADVAASSGAMFINFTSNAGGNRAGFTANWSTSGGASCTTETVADNFNSVSYSQNNGSQNWSTNWLEIGESNGPSAGISRVNSSNCSSGNCLRIGQPSSASSWSNIGAQREVDLSSATSATLTFNYFTGYAQGTQSVTLEVSANGGSSWSPLATYNISGTSFSPTAQSFDISSHKAANTRIRFISSGTSARAGLYVDDLQISYVTNCPLPAIEAEWQFDEAVWSNAANQVQDSSTNNYHADAFNGANTLSSSPALAGDPGTCGYGNFDGSDDHIRLPSSFPNLSGSFTITSWINAHDLDNDQRIFADDKNNSGGFAFSLGDGGDGKLRFFSRSVSPVVVDTQNAVITQNNWIFVAAVHDATAKTRQIYVNGTAVALNTGGTSSTYTGSWGTDSGQASIGGEINSAGSEANANWRFDGLIDEVRVYQDALTATQVQTVMAERHACPAATVDHLNISHSGSAVTCDAETITLSAHQSGHSVDTSYTQTVNLTTSTGRGDWSLISGGSNGTLNNGTANDGAATYNFVSADNGSVQLGLSNTTVEVLSINVSDGSISETSGAATASDDPDLNFKASGLRFLANSSVGAIGTQISGKNSDVAPGNQTLELQAIRTNSSGTCEAALINSHDIQLAYECRDPGTCSTGISASINGTDIGVNSSGSINNYEPVTLDFGDATVSTASFTLNYPDAGELRLYASYNDATIGLLTGSSNNFVVKPAGLCIEATESNSGCASADPTNPACDAFKKAGETFNLRITGVGWETSGESHSDFCTGNSTTPNFQLNNIALTSNLVEPSPGNNASLGVTNFNMASADNGIHNIANQSLSEVGVFTITATPPGYLGESIAASNSANIGRFYPDHFSLSAGIITEACIAGAFSYLGQNFSASYLLTAKNTADITTTNYRGDFVRLNTPLASPGWPNSLSFGAIDNTVPTLLSSRLTHITSGFTWHNNGTGTVISTLNIARLDTGTPGNSVVDGPFTAQLGVLPEDADFVTVPAADRNLDTDNSAPDDHFLIGSSTQRFGRMVIDNAFGPEVLDLGIPVRTEFWEGGAFINNTVDLCSVNTFDGTTLINDSDFTITDPAPAPSDSLTEASLSSKTYTLSTTHIRNLILGAPNTPGPLDISLDVPDWLEFNFSGGATDEDPSGRALFGQYRGNDRIIYWREQF